MLQQARSNRRASEQELGRICRAHGAEMNFVFTVCDTRRKKMMPCLARPAYYRALGRSDPAPWRVRPEQIERAFRDHS